MGRLACTSVLTLFFLISSAASVLANFRETAAPFIDDLGTRAIAVFSDSQTSRQEKAEKFREIFREGFAVKSLAVFTLGRFGRKADDALIEEYVGLFDEYIALSYSARFTSYSGETFEVVNVLDDKDGQGKPIGARVTSNILNGGSKIRVDWRVREHRGKPIVVDVIVEGVSMAISQQKEFVSVIGSNGGDIRALMNVLRKKNAELKTN